MKIDWDKIDTIAKENHIMIKYLRENVDKGALYINSIKKEKDYFIVDYNFYDIYNKKTNVRKDDYIVWLRKEKINKLLNGKVLL